MTQYAHSIIDTFQFKILFGILLFIVCTSNLFKLIMGNGQFGMYFVGSGPPPGNSGDDTLTASSCTNRAVSRDYERVLYKTGRFPYAQSKSASPSDTPRVTGEASNARLNTCGPLLGNRPLADIPQRYDSSTSLGKGNISAFPMVGRNLGLSYNRVFRHRDDFHLNYKENYTSAVVKPLFPYPGYACHPCSYGSEDFGTCDLNPPKYGGCLTSSYLSSGGNALKCVTDNFTSSICDSGTCSDYTPVVKVSKACNSFPKDPKGCQTDPSPWVLNENLRNGKLMVVTPNSRFSKPVGAPSNVYAKPQSEGVFQPQKTDKKGGGGRAKGAQTNPGAPVDDSNGPDPGQNDLVESFPFDPYGTGGGVPAYNFGRTENNVQGGTNGPIHGTGVPTIGSKSPSKMKSQNPSNNTNKPTGIVKPTVSSSKSTGPGKTRENGRPGTENNPFGNATTGSNNPVSNKPGTSAGNAVPGNYINPETGKPFVNGAPGSPSVDKGPHGIPFGNGAPGPTSENYAPETPVRNGNSVPTSGNRTPAGNMAPAPLDGNRGHPVPEVKNGTPLHSQGQPTQTFDKGQSFKNETPGPGPGGRGVGKGNNAHGNGMPGSGGGGGNDIPGISGNAVPGAVNGSKGPNNAYGNDKPTSANPNNLPTQPFGNGSSANPNNLPTNPFGNGSSASPNNLSTNPFGNASANPNNLPTNPFGNGSSASPNNLPTKTFGNSSPQPTTPGNTIGNIGPGATNGQGTPRKSFGNGSPQSPVSGNTIGNNGPGATSGQSAPRKSFGNGTPTLGSKSGTHISQRPFGNQIPGPNGLPTLGNGIVTSNSVAGFQRKSPQNNASGGGNPLGNGANHVGPPKQGNKTYNGGPQTGSSIPSNPTMQRKPSTGKSIRETLPRPTQSSPNTKEENSQPKRKSNKGLFRHPESTNGPRRTSINGGGGNTKPPESFGPPKGSRAQVTPVPNNTSRTRNNGLPTGGMVNNSPVGLGNGVTNSSPNVAYHQAATGGRNPEIASGSPNPNAFRQSPNPLQNQVTPIPPTKITNSSGGLQNGDSGAPGFGYNHGVPVSAAPNRQTDLTQNPLQPFQHQSQNNGTPYPPSTFAGNTFPGAVNGSKGPNNADGNNIPTTVHSYPPSTFSSTPGGQSDNGRNIPATGTRPIAPVSPMTNPAEATNGSPTPYQYQTPQNQQQSNEPPYSPAPFILVSRPSITKGVQTEANTNPDPETLASTPPPPLPIQNRPIYTAKKLEGDDSPPYFTPTPIQRGKKFRNQLPARNLQTASSSGSSPERSYPNPLPTSAPAGSRPGHWQIPWSAGSSPERSNNTQPKVGVNGGTNTSPNNVSPQAPNKRPVPQIAVIPPVPNPRPAPQIVVVAPVQNPKSPDAINQSGGLKRYPSRQGTSKDGPVFMARKQSVNQLKESLSRQGGPKSGNQHNLRLPPGQNVPLNEKRTTIEGVLTIPSKLSIAALRQGDIKIAPTSVVKREMADDEIAGENYVTLPKGNPSRMRLVSALKKPPASTTKPSPPVPTKPNPKQSVTRTRSVHFKGVPPTP